jgi:nucleoside phosphorylase
MKCGYLCNTHRGLFREHGGSEKHLQAIETMLNQVRRIALGKSEDSCSNDIFPDRVSCDVLVITALQDELDAFIGATGIANVWSDCSLNFGGSYRIVQTFYSTEMELNGGQKAKIVASSAEQMGLTASAILSTQAIMLLNPSLVVMVGIAAGVKGDGRDYGDVLIADPAFNYSSGKIRTEKDGGFSPDYRPIPLNRTVLTSVRRYLQNESIFQKIHANFNGNKPRQYPKVYIGPFGSADQVVDDISIVEGIKKHQRKVIGIDMETYAVYRACQESCVKNEPNYISIKSICDFASEKSDNWQSYANFTDSNFACYFIQEYVSAFRGI